MIVVQRTMHKLFVTGNYHEQFNVPVFTKCLFVSRFLAALFLVAGYCVTYAWFMSMGPGVYPSHYYLTILLHTNSSTGTSNLGIKNVDLAY